YKSSRWGSRMGDFAPALYQTEALLGNPALLELFRRRVVIPISPARSYLALSKHLLSWIHDPARNVAERDWLARHVARTWSAADREAGGLTPSQALADRETLFLKPCKAGGAHGVIAGRETPKPTWEERLREVWRDPAWVVQTEVVPRR